MKDGDNMDHLKLMTLHPLIIISNINMEIDVTNFNSTYREDMRSVFMHV